MARIAALSAAGSFDQVATTRASSGPNSPIICARICVHPVFTTSGFDGLTGVSAFRVEGSNPFARSIFHPVLAQNPLTIRHNQTIYIMVLPTQPVALSVEQISELNQKLTTLRHDLNNSLSLMAASAELIRRRPANADQMWKTFHDQPRKIADAMAQFSHDLEAALQITR